MQLFQRALTNREKMEPDAVLCLEMDIVLLLLQTSEIEKAKAKLEEYQSTIDSKKTSEAVAFSKYFRALAEYKKVTSSQSPTFSAMSAQVTSFTSPFPLLPYCQQIVGPAHEFYSAGIQFLSYAALEDLRGDEKHILARDMAIAALSGEGIFHFGEVLATPILGSLAGTADEWLQHLVMAINSGDVTQFTAGVTHYAAQYATLAPFHEDIRWKALLLSLITLVFERPSHSRIVSFQDISARLQVPLDQVEWVVMKGMALGLIKGSIDEVAQSVQVTWIQPRVLDIAQLSAINQQLGIWTEKYVATMKLKPQTISSFPLSYFIQLLWSLPFSNHSLSCFF